MTFGEVLAPVRERYAYWLGLDEAGVDEDRQEAPEEVRAIQMVLRMERDATPSRTRALELAATGCALLCLDERSAPGGAWHDAVRAYGGGHIRKVTRRARGAQWEATADLPGLTLADEPTGTEIRVLVPGRVVDLDKRIAKLQVSGTDLPADEASARPSAPERPRGGTASGDGADSGDGTGPTDAAPPATPTASPVLTCVYPAGLSMTAGKLMAQTGHAGMIAAALAAGTDPDLLTAWHAAGCPTRVEEADDARWATLLERMTDPARAWNDSRLLAVRDGGFTEVEPGTVTIVATLA